MKNSLDDVLSENVTSSFCNNFAVIQSHYARKMCSNYPGFKLEPALLRQQNKIEHCHRMFTSSTQLQNRSFHVVERTKTSAKCRKMKNARAKRAKILLFLLSNMQISDVLVAVVVVVA